MKNGAASLILSPIRNLGETFIDGITAIGEVVVLFLSTLKRLPFLPKVMNLTIKQMVSIGVSSLPLLFVTSIFTGMVATVQSEYQFRNLVPDKFVGTAACKMILIELGPILTALVMAGRVGSALAAEIGTMKEKEELAAYEVLGLDPLRYLALPRFVAFFVMLPALSVISNCLALIGGWIVCVLALDITSYTYYTGMQYMFDIRDLFSGVLKSFVFGTLIYLLGYYCGLKAGAGAKGVGFATMNVVVSSCVSILIFDLIVAMLIFN
ncbi:MAG: ABC transporter permease [Candidatus Fibromonas sp.]|jgi:phospholipid/cholesterol/gamma-HCH transport system permease protein|nr:ABC transporter permease [Candidatus Fibromonas sp.]